MRPDDAEVRAFLDRSMVARVALLAPQGQPFMTPLWFVCASGKLHLPTGQGSLAVRYITATPRIVLLFDAERGERSDRVLRITGSATVRNGAPSTAVLLRVVVKYYISSISRGLAAYLRKYPLLRSYYAQGHGAAVIEATPETAEFIARP